MKRHPGTLNRGLPLIFKIFISQSMLKKPTGFNEIIHRNGILTDPVRKTGK